MSLNLAAWAPLMSEKQTGEPIMAIFGDTGADEAEAARLVG
jgi:hypothetical protein